MKKYSGYIFLIIIFILLLLLFYCYCLRRDRKGPEPVKHWISWNLLFTPNSLGTSQGVVQDFETYLTNYVHGYDPSATLNFQLLYCPCDSLLTNIDATLLTGSGNTIPPPPTKPNPGPSGDYTLANNFAMEIPVYQNHNFVDSGNTIKDTSNISITPVPPSLRKTLAVIDTGLDTALFKIAFPNTIWNGDLLWQDIVGRSTIFDVVPGEANGVLMDDNSVKHGTAATGIVLSQIYRTQPDRTPRIMAIRAFDKDEKGSIYTVSCALSYAIQHQANFVNASWGYYGEEDFVLKHYLLKADSHAIHILAAAGNTPGHHFSNSVCNTYPNDQNNLDRLYRSDSLFYPACFAPVIPNLVSVTQLNKVNISNQHPIVPCFYQNFSPGYITVGAIDLTAASDECCSFKVPFLSGRIEGSSFATPVVTGILMSTMPDNDRDIKLFISTHKSGQSIEKFTNNGDYFIYQHRQ